MINDMRKIKLGEVYTPDELNYSEDFIQSVVFKALWNKHPEHRYRFFAIPNGGSRNKVEAAKMKGTGTLAGVWDFVVLKKKGTAVFLEFKAPKKPLTAEQLIFAELNENFDFFVFDNAEIAINEILKILNE